MVGTIAFLVRGLIVIVAALLLFSLGGAAIYAAPVTLPLLLVIAARSTERGWRIAAAVVGTFTALELTWSVAWVISENELAAFLIGSVVGLMVGIGFLNARRTTCQPTR